MSGALKLVVIAALLLGATCFDLPNTPEGIETSEPICVCEWRPPIIKHEDILNETFRRGCLHIGCVVLEISYNDPIVKIGQSLAYLSVGVTALAVAACGIAVSAAVGWVAYWLFQLAM